MMSYAFRALNKQGYRKLETESFDNAKDLCGTILVEAISSQLKRGLNKEYIEKEETASTIKGKVDISKSIKNHEITQRKVNCVYDDFNVNSYMNRIVKTAMNLLLKSDVKEELKVKIKKIIIFFDQVNTIDINQINWNLQYDRNNQTYELIIGMCYLIIKGLIQTQKEGNIKLMDFVDDQRMCALYQKFILEYYRKEHHELKANASQILWQIDSGNTDLLPIMQTDVVLSKGNKTLIIDAKYYNHSTVERFGKMSLHTNNWYQIYSYVCNKKLELNNEDCDVAGMLLYAKTEDLINPDVEVQLRGGSYLYVKNLDLNCDFTVIKKQLDDIANNYLL